MNRHDHTSWLIHFVRDRIPQQDFPAEVPENANMDYFTSPELDHGADAFSVLQTIIRLGGIFAGYSIRNNKTTIYGGSPVVCATEMPLYSFAKHVENDRKRAAPYGIAFKKREFFEAGGRPVIYGLSEKPNVKHQSMLSKEIDEAALPLKEQYRYVPYSHGDTFIDWTHEREWRWKPVNERHDYITCRTGEYCGGSLSGLPIFDGKENEGYFSELRIIVNTQKDADEIQKQLTGYYYAQSNDYSTPFSRSLISRSKLIVLEKIVQSIESGYLNSQTIEGVEAANLIKPVILLNISDEDISVLNNSLDRALKAGKDAAIEYLSNHSDVHLELVGFSTLVTYEITSPYIQYMLQIGMASTYDGCIHINIDNKGDWQYYSSLNYKDRICTAMADVLKRELGISFFVQNRYD